MSSAAWAGQLNLVPGMAEGAARLQRPDVAGRLLQGCAAAQVPTRVGAVFTLCAQVQALTARQALGAASAAQQGLAADQDEAIAQHLALATAREHVLRITQDWPATLAAAAGLADLPRLPASALAACPLWRAGVADADRLGQLGPWLAEHLLGMPPDAWLAAHLAEPETWAARWCGLALDEQVTSSTFSTSAGRSQATKLSTGTTNIRTATSTAAALHAVAARAQALATPAQAWAWPADPAQALAAAQRLARALATHPGFAERPSWQGQACDTGPWWRVHGPAMGAQAQQRLVAASSSQAWGRLISRLADLAWLACAPDAARARGFAPPQLSHGAANTGPLQGLAWSEMARGLLVHWVQLAESSAGLVVARYRVLAPTEWNSQPQGGLAQAVAALAPGDAAAARLLALAYDPCVPVQVLHPPLPDTAEPQHA